MGKLVGAEALETELAKQLRRAESLDASPALVMIRPENETLVEKLGEVVLGLDMSNVNFGTEKNPQFIDYVAEYKGAIAIILEKGCNYGDEALEQIKRTILTKASESLGANVLLAGTSCYKKEKSADVMLAEAYKL